MRVSIAAPYMEMTAPFPEIWFATEPGAKRNRRRLADEAAAVAQEYKVAYGNAMEPFFRQQLIVASPVRGGEDSNLGDEAILAGTYSVLYLIEQTHPRFMEARTECGATLRSVFEGRLGSATQLAEWYLIHAAIAGVFTAVGFRGEQHGEG